MLLNSNSVVLFPAGEGRGESARKQQYRGGKWIWMKFAEVSLHLLPDFECICYVVQLEMVHDFFHFSLLFQSFCRYFSLHIWFCSIMSDWMKNLCKRKQGNVDSECIYISLLLPVLENTISSFSQCASKWFPFSISNFDFQWINYCHNIDVVCWAIIIYLWTGFLSPGDCFGSDRFSLYLPMFLSHENMRIGPSMAIFNTSFTVRKSFELIFFEPHTTSHIKPPKSFTPTQTVPNHLDPIYHWQRHHKILLKHLKVNIALEKRLEHTIKL